MRRAVLAAAVCLLGLAWLAGCGDEEAVDPEAEEAARLLSVGEVTPECSTGVRWVGELEGSGLMLPGEDCIGCHVGLGGPVFTAAGTIHGDFRDEDGCAGIAGVTVRLTGADGGVVEVVTNAAGNFYTAAPIQVPYQVLLLRGERRRVMPVPQSEGSCALCHTQAGRAGAPGRAVAPR